MSVTGYWGKAKCILSKRGLLVINTDNKDVIAGKSNKAFWYKYTKQDKKK